MFVPLSSSKINLVIFFSGNTFRGANHSLTVNLLPEEYLLPSQDMTVQPSEGNSPEKLIYKLQSRDSMGEAIEYSQLNASANREKMDITD